MVTNNDSEGLVAVLGEGRCSLVVSISTHALTTLLASDETCHIPLLLDASRVALRLIKLHKNRVPVEEPTVRTVLQPYIGTIWYITFSDTLRDFVKEQLDQSWAEKIDSCDDAAVMPDFSAPCVRGNSTPLCRTTYEIKPKGVWQRPRVIGLALDGAPQKHRHVLVDEEKFRQCRFSMMQAHKRRKVKGRQTLQVTQNRYCPNDLLRKRNIERSLHSLNAMPENNLRVLSKQKQFGSLGMQLENRCIAAEEHATGAPIPSLEIEVLATVFRHCDLFDRLVTLQEGQPGGCPVLDIALLHEWNLSGGGEANAQLLVDTDSLVRCEDCACCVAREAGQHTAPAKSAFEVQRPNFSFADAVEAFYVATTAKDLSIIVTLETCHGEPHIAVIATSARDSENSDDIDSAYLCSEAHSTTGGKVFVVRRQCDEACDVYYVVRVAAVDIDCKRHKPLSHYFHQDIEILESFRQEEVVAKVT